MPLSSSEPNPRANRWTLAVLMTAFVLFLAYLLRYVLLPFVIAGGLAYVCTPVVESLQRRFRIPRWTAALVPFLIFLAALACLGLLIKAYALPQASALLSDLGNLLERFLQTLSRGGKIRVMDKTYTAHEAAQTLMNSAGSFLRPADAITDVGLVFGVLMGGVLCVVLLFYFLIDGPRIGRGLLWMIPPAIRPEALAVGRRAGPMIFRYVRGVIIVTLYATSLTWVVTRWLLHVPHALLLAIAVGLLELIPVIGPILAIAMIGLVAIEQVTFWGIVGVILFATGLRLSIDQLVGPLVLGKAVSVPPPLIIFSFLAGGAIWGILGVVVAIPVAAIIKIILEEAYGTQTS